MNVIMQCNFTMLLPTGMHLFINTTQCFPCGAGEVTKSAELYCVGMMVRVFVGVGVSVTHTVREQAVMVRNPAEAGLRKQSCAWLYCTTLNKLALRNRKRSAAQSEDELYHL